jgi:hypothetical protein
MLVMLGLLSQVSVLSSKLVFIFLLCDVKAKLMAMCTSEALIGNFCVSSAPACNSVIPDLGEMRIFI